VTVVRPEGDACLRCAFESRELEAGASASAGPQAALAGTLAALEGARLLEGGASGQGARVVVMRGPDITVETAPLSRKAACEVCAAAAGTLQEAPA
jgi:hypothetical protein